MKSISVLGSGGWGIALSGLLAECGHRVRLWGRDPARMAELARARECARALPGIRIPETVEVVGDPRAAAGADLLVVAIPAQFVRAALAPFAPLVAKTTPVVTGTKGLEIGTLRRPSEVLRERLGPRPVAVLSGPSHAEEIARGLPASLAVASDDAALAREVREDFGSTRLRLYVSDDLLGTELAGALKNVMAIAAGVCDGLALGDNAKAALVTRALAEMIRYGTARGAKPETFAGLAGLGDLLTTCYSRHGRNRAVGERLGRGEPAAKILASMTQVAEGIGTAKALRDAGAADEDSMPVAREVYALLFEGKDPRRSVVDLMTRPPREG